MALMDTRSRFPILHQFRNSVSPPADAGVSVGAAPRDYCASVTVRAPLV